MKIFYFSIFDVFRARTNQIADIRLCEGFAQAGCNVEMITPYVYRPDNMRRDEIFDFYGVETPFRLTILRTPFVDHMRAIVVLPVMLAFVLLATLRILVVNRGELADTVVISRTPDLLLPVLVLKRLFRMRRGPLVVTWAHELIFRRRYEWVYRNSDAVVGTNSAITEDLVSKLGIAKERTAISLNPISESQLRGRVSRDAARAALGLNVERPLVVYTGKVGVGIREIAYILEAAAMLPDYQFLFTGGKPEAVRHYKEQCERRGIRNVTFVGFLHDYSQVRNYQAASDVLVSYYTTEDHMTRYNLPNKICEYMLSGSPIVSCDFPATRDVLNANNAIFVAPESADELVRGIRLAVENGELARAVAERAYQDVRQMTFRRRAESLVSFFRTLRPQNPA